MRPLRELSTSSTFWARFVAAPVMPLRTCGGVDGAACRGLCVLGMDSLRLLETMDPWQWPETARDTVLAGLDDARADRRLLAAELSSGIVDDAVAMRLLKLLCEDPDERVRAAAAIAFGPALEECDTSDWEDDFDLPPIGKACFGEIRRTLERTYRDAEAPKLVRRRALEAAVRAPEPWQRGASRAAWRSSDDEWRTTAVFCMGYLGDFDVELMEAIETPEFLAGAVVSAGLCGAEPAGARVLALARSCTERDLRLSAIEALGSLHPPDAQELLLELSVSDDEEVAAVASEALALRGESPFGDLDDEDDLG